MKPTFRLVSDVISDDTVEALEQLLDEARRGRVIGIAFAAMMKRRTFIVNAAGEAKRNPVFTRGMLACLDDTLGRQADNPL